MINRIKPKKLKPYLRCERETIIRYDNETDTATVNTFNVAFQDRLERMMDEYPDQVILKHDYVEDGYDGIIVTMPKSWIKIRTPMKMTDEQRRTKSERAKATGFKSKANSTVNEP